jgi:hypothetical protein
MRTLRGCCLSPSGVVCCNGAPNLERASPCYAQHRIKTATSYPELLAVAELCAHEFSSTRLSDMLALNGGPSQLVGLVQTFEGVLTDQAVKELLERFSQLETRKRAGKVRTIYFVVRRSHNQEVSRMLRPLSPYHSPSGTLNRL